MRHYLVCLGLIFTLLGWGNAQAGEKRLFTVTGYYSPLPNQTFYVTGDYQSEIRLNGRGIAGADGTPVFPGIIAAPKDYAFGTKICLPNFGCGAVHDRGGAIVNKGQRTLARHDRLDLWLGYGEEGLARALDLGVWQTEGEIFSPDSNVELGVNFKTVTPIPQILDLPGKLIFPQNLSLNHQGKAVNQLQTALARIGFYHASPSSTYDALTTKAVLDFQLYHQVVDSKKATGAGNFGPKTREILSEVLYQNDLHQAALKRWGKFQFEKNLNRGARDEAVWNLQEILIQAEVLDHKPTGYFGRLTKAALIEFQLQERIISSANQAGAGTVGPATRTKLNQIITAKTQRQESETFALIQYQKRTGQIQLVFNSINNKILR